MPVDNGSTCKIRYFSHYDKIFGGFSMSYPYNKVKKAVFD